MIFAHIWRISMHSPQVCGSKLAFPLIFVNVFSIYRAPSLPSRAVCLVLQIGELVPGSVKLRVSGENQAFIKQKQRHFTDCDRHSPGEDTGPGEREAAGPGRVGAQDATASEKVCEQDGV